MRSRPLLLFIITAVLIAASSSAMAFKPSGKVDCIAPSDPRGGWGFTCRSLGKLLQDLQLVPRSVQTTNMADAGGA